MSNPLEHIIIAGVTGTEQSPAAVDAAAGEAARRDLPLLLLSAFPAGDGAGPHTSLTAVVRRICVTRPGLAVAARNVTGKLAEEIIEASRSAGLVVVGQDAAASIVAQVAAHSRCPTMVVPPHGESDATGPVLLGLGMSVDDEPAIAFAFEEAALRDVRLLAVHVWAGIPASAVGTISPFAYDLQRAQAAADEMLANELARWQAKYPEVTVERMPLYDVNPAQTLLDASERAGLVVMGSHRRSLGGSQLLGGVTRAVIARATRPVVVVGATGHLW